MLSGSLGLVPMHAKPDDDIIPLVGARYFTAWEFPWLAVLGLLIVGLIWLVTFYITQGAFPVEAWGNWNILIGFAFFVAGLIMSTRWR